MSMLSLTGLEGKSNVTFCWNDNRREQTLSVGLMHSMESRDCENKHIKNIAQSGVQTESVTSKYIHQLPINIGTVAVYTHTHTHKHKQTAISVHVYWDEKSVKLRDTNFIFGIINVQSCKYKCIGIVELRDGHSTPLPTHHWIEGEELSCLTLHCPQLHVALDLLELHHLEEQLIRDLAQEDDLRGVDIVTQL